MENISRLSLPSSCFFFFSSRRRHTRYWRDWSSDVCSSDLGSVDLSKLGEYGESDPRAFSLDGELEVANRGIVEMVEMLKADEKFLYVLLTLADRKSVV